MTAPDANSKAAQLRALLLHHSKKADTSQFRELLTLLPDDGLVLVSTTTAEMGLVKLRRHVIDELARRFGGREPIKEIAKVVITKSLLESADVPRLQSITDAWSFLFDGDNSDDALAGLHALQAEIRNRKVDGLTRAGTEQIDVDTLELIHGIERQQDGFISLCRKANVEKDGEVTRQHQDLASIRSRDLRQWLPQLLEYILKDAYFTVNAAFRSGVGKNPMTGAPDTKVFKKGKYDGTVRQERYLRYLNACFVDLDCYKNGLQWSEAVQIVLQAQDENIIPPASIIVRSGQGLYLLWLLTSEREGAQQRAFPSEIVLYKQINRKLMDCLNAYDPRLHADRQTGAASQILRVPGSEHTKANQTVVAQVQVVQGGRVPTFTLKKLAAFYDIPITPQLPGRTSNFLRPIKNRGSRPAGRRGKIATGNYRLSDVLTIAQHRGGIEEGKRYVTLWYFAHFAKAAGYTLSDIEGMVAQLADACRPPYPSEEADTPTAEIVKRVWAASGSPRFKNASLAKWFEVTPELADELNLRSIIPVAVRDARAAEPPPRAKAQRSRRQIITEMIAEHPGRVPRIRAIKARLAAADLDASTRTISRDLKGYFL